MSQLASDAEIPLPAAALPAEQTRAAARSARLGEGRDSHVLMVQDCTLSFSV